MFVRERRVYYVMQRADPKSEYLTDRSMSSTPSDSLNPKSTMRNDTPEPSDEQSGQEHFFQSSMQLGSVAKRVKASHF